MKKVTAIIGSPRRRLSYEAVKQMESYLKARGEIDFEIVFLKDIRLEYCKGCNQCFDRGEDRCPLNDDRDMLLEKIRLSDGVILATPNYAFQVSALTKTFLDRMAFTLHRPCFFGKAFTVIVAQGIFGGNKIVKYLTSLGGNMGFEAAKGCCLTALEPRSPRIQQQIDRNVSKAAERFYRTLSRPAPSPSLFRLMLFRITRSMMLIAQEEKSRDYRYYQQKGWFTSDYYYEVRLGPAKRVMGALFDLVGRRMAKQRKPDEKPDEPDTAGAS